MVTKNVDHDPPRAARIDLGIETGLTKLTGQVALPQNDDPQEDHLQDLPVDPELRCVLIVDVPPKNLKRCLKKVK